MHSQKQAQIKKNVKIIVLCATIKLVFFVGLRETAINWLKMIIGIKTERVEEINPTKIIKRSLHKPS